MAFDPQHEDYQRLMLRFARTLKGDQLENVRTFATFPHRFARDRDSLPQTDADRAFHLVATATSLIDYELPFATDEAAETITARARNLLDEALALDPLCHDARRMLQEAQSQSFEGAYAFLRDGAEEVRARCEEAREAASREEQVERTGLAERLALHPYLRWMAALASKAVVCGRNREALRHARTLLELDPTDVADVRFTAALALAKLEDEAGLDELAERGYGAVRRTADDAWLCLARACVAHRRRDFAAARRQLVLVVNAYPHAAAGLARQRELPDGVFARLPCEPYSEDELVIAVSEATVLFQEGRDDLGLGVFGAWVMREALTQASVEQLGELHDLMELADGAELLAERWRERPGAPDNDADDDQEDGDQEDGPASPPDGGAPPGADPLGDQGGGGR